MRQHTQASNTKELKSGAILKQVVVQIFERNEKKNIKLCFIYSNVALLGMTAVL